MGYPTNVVSESSFSRVEPIITPQQLKERYLFGVPLMDEKGNPMPDTVLQHQINAAISYLEHKLDIIISPLTLVEQYDYRAVDYANFNFISLKHRPVIEIQELKAKFPNNKELVAYPKEWFVLENESGQVQLSPVEGSFSGLIVTQGGSYVPLIYGTRDHWPHLFHIKYEAGFCPDSLPVIINEMIGMQAAIRTFEIIGDLILGLGISSESVSLDGTSVSKNGVASSTSNAFGPRLKSYKDQMEEYMKVVKNHYNAIPMIIG